MTSDERVAPLVAAQMFLLGKGRKVLESILQYLYIGPQGYDSFRLISIDEGSICVGKRPGGNDGGRMASDE